MADMENQEVLFENAFLMTQERYLFLCNHPKIKRYIKRRRRWEIIQSACLMVAICIVIIGTIQKERYLAAIGVAFVFVFLYKCFFQLRIRNKKLYSMIRKSQASEEWNRITRFYKSGIEVEDVNNVVKTGYHQINRLTDDGEECILWIENNSVVRLMHSEFTVGNYENFTSFINQKLAENAEDEAEKIQ